jgi:predicted N-acetyltransferase YhbS
VTLHAPELLAAEHVVDGFDCGEPSLNEWLRRRAKANQAAGASRTFVLRDDEAIVGYYALAAGAVSQEEATGRFRRKMPEPIPVVLLGRLAVAKSHQTQRLGSALFQDAARRVVAAADFIGVRGLLVHALSDKAAAFYERLGLSRSPLDPKILMVTLQDLQASLRP